MIKRRSLESWYLITIFLLANAGLVQAGTITIGPVASYDFSSIQAGIDAASAGDTVLVAPGEYVITEPITFRGKAITVRSKAGPDETTIRMGTPADPDRGSVVVFENNETAASVLDGFTITGGTGFRLWVPPESEFAWAGGGIYFDASSGTVRDCAIVQNRAKHAGGVLTSSGPFVTLIDCIVAGNTAEGGVCGGVMCWDNSHVTMTKCTIAGNSSVGHGGGVYCRRDDFSQESSLTMADCVVSGNSS
ncbi:MAG: right-handed parallel beta-helix repeat-containing protein, partial [Phycisphaerales bacterium]